MEKSNKFKEYLKKNYVYLILAFCVLAIGLSVTLVLAKSLRGVDTSVADNGTETPSTTDDKTGEDSGDNPADPEVFEIVFDLPVADYTGISEYSTVMAFNGTLKRYEAHLATDFFAPEGSAVTAVYGGVVESVENTLLEGVTVTVDHGNGLKTVYNSLSDGDLIKEGQTIEKGDVIGTVSVTNRQEYRDGAHLHFKVLENGISVDPAKYITAFQK